MGRELPIPASGLYAPSATTEWPSGQVRNADAASPGSNPRDSDGLHELEDYFESGNYSSDEDPAACDELQKLVKA
eukprot:3094254-Amphidinium_carterae.1